MHVLCSPYWRHCGSATRRPLHAQTATLRVIPLGSSPAVSPPVVQRALSFSKFMGSTHVACNVITVQRRWRITRSGCAILGLLGAIVQYHRASVDIVGRPPIVVMATPCPGSSTWPGTGARILSYRPLAFSCGLSCKRFCFYACDLA